MAESEWRSSDVRYLRAIIESGDPVVTATELADDVGVSQQAAYSKLNDMKERGLVRSKKVGARARVWWITTTGRDAYRESSQ